MAKKKKIDTHGVFVKFVELDDDDNIIKIHAEKDFPDVDFEMYPDIWNNQLTHYRCYNHDVGEWRHKTHMELDRKYNFVDYDNCPNIQVNYYNSEGLLLKRESCVEYEYNL